MPKTIINSMAPSLCGKCGGSVLPEPSSSRRRRFTGEMRGILLLAVLLWAPLLPAGAFQPPDCLGLTLWVRADAGVTAGAEGVVSAWADQSGNGNDFRQADPNLQPRRVAEAVNGLPALRFDGVDDALTLATAPLPLAGKSVFAVIKWDHQRPYSFAIGLDAGTDGYLRMFTETALLTGGLYPVLYQNGIPYPKEGRPGETVSKLRTFFEQIGNQKDQI